MAQPSQPTLGSTSPPQVQVADATPEDDDFPASSRCARCSGPEGQNGRKLIVCIDGTSNQFSKNNTNVVELYNRLKKNDDQLTYYNSGIGTFAKPSWFSPTYVWQWTSSAIDLLFARRIDRIVKQAYRWLSEHYRPGDRIYLFGFSRGAYQVRVLAAMIDRVGLLHKGNLDQIPFAYRLYATSQDRSEPVAMDLPTEADSVAPATPETAQGANTSAEDAEEEEESTTEEVLASFKGAFSHEHARVHFVGVWDTVSSVGIFYHKTLPGTTTGMDSACFFRHALALHERRVRFLPEYANGGTGKASSPLLEKDIMGPTNRPVSPSSSTPTLSEDVGATQLAAPRVKEVWFAGCHSDIGGGNLRNVKLQRFSPALRWMCFEAATAGLEFHTPPKGWAPRSKTHDSMSLGWRIVEYVPLTHRSYRRDTDSNHSETWWRCHRGAPRIIAKDHLVHATALPPSEVEKKSRGNTPPERRNDEWSQPPATFDSDDGSRSWEIARSGTASFIEPDPYTQAESVEKFLSGLSGIQQCLKTLETTNVSYNARLLKVLLSTDRGRRAMQEAAQGHPRSMALEALDMLFSISRLTVRTTQAPNQRAAQQAFAAAEQNVRDTLASSHHVLRRPLFKELIPDLCALPAEDRKALKDRLGTRPIAGTQTIQRLEYTNSVPFIAYTQEQRKLCCASSEFGLSSWDVDDYRCARLLGPGDDPETVTVSNPRSALGDYVAWAILSANEGILLSGTERGLLQQWSVRSGQQRRHDIQIDIGEYHEVLATGDDSDSNTNEPIHIDADLTCLATSSDGSLLVTAWTAGYTRSLAVYDLQSLLADSSSPMATASHIQRSAHSSRIESVTFSPHDSSILTTSWDGLVKMWHMGNNRDIVCDKSFVWHAGAVNHAAFSPLDDSLIVSGSDDYTVIVWDTKSGEPKLAPLHGHESSVSCVAFSPDATKVVSGSWDKTVRLWKTADGSPIGVYRGHSNVVTCVVYKGDGSQFASSGRDGRVFQWDEWDEEELEKGIAAQNSAKQQAAAKQPAAQGGRDEEESHV